MARNCLDSETLAEIEAYAHGMHLDPIYFVRDTIPADDREAIAFWLKTKTDLEGPPIRALVEEIAAEGHILRPVVLDVKNDLAVEGRHRLAAALKYGFDVPVVLISDATGKGRGWRKLC